MGLGRFPYDLELLLLCLQTPGHFLGTEPFPADDSPIFIPALAELERAESRSFMSRAAIGSFGLYTFRSKKSAVAGHILGLSYYKGSLPKKNIQNVNFFQIGPDPPPL